MKNIYIITAFIYSISSSSVFSSENISTCLPLTEQAPITNTENKIYLVLNNAFINNNCRLGRQLLIKNVEQTKINGLTVLHKPTENIPHIKIINKFNISSFKKHLKKNEKTTINASFSKASLSALSDVIDDMCKLKIKLTKSKKKKFTLLSQKAISKYEFCLNSASIFAGSNVKLQYLNGVFNEMVKK